MAIAAVWALALGSVLVVASRTKVGPVLVTLSERHGVHTGEAVVLVVVCGVAAIVTRMIVRRANAVPATS